MFRANQIPYKGLKASMTFHDRYTFTRSSVGWRKGPGRESRLFTTKRCRALLSRLIGAIQERILMVLQEKDIAGGDRQGIDRIVAKYRRKFRVTENLEYYSEADFHEAERQYLRFCLANGRC